MKYKIGDIVETDERLRGGGYAKSEIYDITWEVLNDNTGFSRLSGRYHIRYIDESPYGDNMSNRIADSWIRKLISRNIEPIKHIRTLTTWE